MSNTWYVLVAGEEIGPLGDNEIREMVAKGQLTPSDMIRKVPGVNWHPTASVRGLFQPVEPTAVAQNPETPTPTAQLRTTPRETGNSSPYFAEVASQGSIQRKKLKPRWLIPTIIACLLPIGILGALVDSSSQKGSHSEPALSSAQLPTIAPVRFDIQGMRIGDALTRAWGKSHCPVNYESKSDVLCDDSIDVGGVRVFVMYHFHNYRLISVSLSYKSDVFENIVKAYTGKFGVPPHEVREEQYTTRLGVKAMNYIATWETDSGPFIVRRFGSTIDRGYAVLYSPGYAEYLTKQKRQQQTELQEKL